MRPDLLLVKGSTRFASKKSVILYAWRRQVTILPTAPVCSQFCTYFQIYNPCHLAVSFLATSPAHEVSFFFPLVIIISCIHELHVSSSITQSCCHRPWWLHFCVSLTGMDDGKILCSCADLEMFCELRFESPRDLLCLETRWWMYLTTLKGTLGHAGEI